MVKLDSGLRRVIFSKSLGVTAATTGLVLDSADNIYITGQTRNFPVTPGAFQTSRPVWVDRWG